MQLSNLKKNVNLFPYNTLRVKAEAQFFLEARSREDLLNVVKLAKKDKLPLFVIGGGSNLVITKHEIPGIVVRNLYIKKEVVAEASQTIDLSISSGYPVGKLVNETTMEGLSGVEHHLGLPGTVGGALYMNSKWTHPEIYFGDTLVSAVLIDKNGNEKKVNREYFHFAYDYSILQRTHEIVLEAVFRFKKEPSSVVKKRAADALLYRKKTQPFGVASSGCFFQNITEEERKKIGVATKSAGNLIDKSGLKGQRVGAFIVSPHHANFVINEGEGKTEDLKKILSLMKQKVKEKFHIDLKEEVIVI